MKDKRLWIGLLCAAGILILILDAKTAYQGALDGIQLCTMVVIPSLLPFFLLCPILSSTWLGVKTGLFKVPGRILGIPRGGESLFLIGIIGGYPVGASTINEACKVGSLRKDDARRLLGFCCNAGPGFLFGVLGSLFEQRIILWIIWAIHILSALLVGILLPGKSKSECRLPERPILPLSAALHLAIRNLASVCGWVILLRILITFCKRWFLWLFPAEGQILITGILELTNGCCDLLALRTDGLRYILACVLLGFGGLCVILQTVSVTRESGMGMYFPGKLLQALISFLLASSTQSLLFPSDQIWKPQLHLVAAVAVFAVILVLFLHKKTVAFRPKVLYNASKVAQTR